jgi:Tol biopolymer transport system component
VAGNGFSSLPPAISSTGSAALFTATSTNLGDFPGNRFSRVHVRRLTPDPNIDAGGVKLVSRPSGTGPFASLTDYSRLFGTAASSDGRYVAFESQSDSLSKSDDNRFQNVFVRDLLTNHTVLVSRTTGPKGAAANDSSSLGGISADGRRVVFTSSATNLRKAGNGGIPQAYVRDLTAGTTTLVSRANGATGTPATTAAFGAGISGNGKAVLIVTSSALDPAGANGVFHVYVRNIAEGSTILVDRDDGTAGAVSPVSSGEPAINRDGTRVVWVSTAGMAGAPANGVLHVFRRDLRTHTTFLVSRAEGKNGVSAETDSRNPVINAAGDVVAFSTRSQNLGETFFDTQVFVRDIAGGHTHLVSRATGPTGTISRDAEFQSIDATGDHVAFAALDLIPTQPAQTYEVYVRNLRTGETTLVSRAAGANGAPANSNSLFSSIAANGNCVAFVTSSTNMRDGFGSADFSSVHLRVLRGECPVRNFSK